MKPLFLLVLSLFVWHPVVAQDAPQPIHSFTQDWPIAGARWKPASHDFWTWNRAFATLADGSTDYQDWLLSWNGDNGRLNTQMQYRGDNVGMNLDWSAGEGRVLVYGGNALEIWDAVNGTKTWTYNYNARISGARWDRAFRRILFWSYDDGSIYIWDTDLEKETFLAQTNMPSDLVDVKWSPDEKTILGIITQAPGQVILWDAATAELKQVFKYPGMIYSADWNADGSGFLMIGDKVIQLVDITTRHLLNGKDGDSFLYRAIWSPDRQRLAVRVETEPLVVIWDAANGNIVSSFTLSSQTENIISEVQWSKDNQRLLTHSPDGIDIWDVTTGANLFHLPVEVSSFNISWLSWSPDETKLVYLRDNSRLQVVTLATRAVVELELPAPIVMSLQSPKFIWNADGSQLLLSGVDSNARVWDITNGKLLATFNHPVHEGFQSQWVTDAQWSPDEQLILTLGTPDYCGGATTCPSEAMVWQAP